MSASSSPLPAADSPRRTLEEQALLIQNIRRDLIQSQITILELQDTILQKETDKADAVAILGQLEHVLEEKINYIIELDRLLNQRIAALENLRAAEETAHGAVVDDLVRKLDAANREIGATHTMAAGYARDLAQARDELQRTTQNLTEIRAELARTCSELTDTQARLRATEEARDAGARQLATIQASWSWKLTAPLRAVRRFFS